MIDTEIVIDPRSERLRTLAEARADKYDGLLEYVAMMADVELPEDEEEATDE